jgi:hypothetical protein
VKRSFATLVATVAGLVALLGFKSASSRPASALHATPPQSPGASTPPSGGGASGPPAGTPSSPASAGPGAGGSGSGNSGSGSGSGGGAAGASRTVTGDTVRTRYGNVQVQITVQGKKITAVAPVQLPDSNGIDLEIDQQVVPILVQESISAQSASIDAISGATYTSDGYIRSLQSAIDKAKL